MVKTAICLFFVMCFRFDSCGVRVCIFGAIVGGAGGGRMGESSFRVVSLRGDVGGRVMRI